MPGMGGAMDLVTEVRNVIVGTTHLNKRGESKLTKKCNLPLTGVGVVSMVVTVYCVMRFPKGRMTLFEIAPGIDVKDLRDATSASFDVHESLSVMIGEDGKED